MSFVRFGSVRLRAAFGTATPLLFQGGDVRQPWPPKKGGKPVSLFPFPPSRIRIGKPYSSQRGRQIRFFESCVSLATNFDDSTRVRAELR
jgi:hypothetical protein